MEQDKTFLAVINQLAFLQVDEPWAQYMGPPKLEDVIGFLCTPDIKYSIDDLVNRYKEISKEEVRLFAAPAEKRILSKLVWPLRQAKGCYIVGNYLGTISLCGMVAEMVTILIFEMSNFTINGRNLDEDSQKGLFGSSFEKLGQDRRVSVLYTYNLIDKNIKDSFDTIRIIRKKYLHFFSQEHDKICLDAISVFVEAVKIVVNVIGQNIVDGKIMLNPQLLRYIEEKGEYIEYNPEKQEG